MLERLSGIVLFCRNTTASQQWYESLGFRHLRGYEGMHWMGIGDLEVMLHPSEDGSGGRLCLNAAVDDVDDAFRVARALGYQPYDHQQPGIPLEGPVAMPWGVRQFELDDPDGHRWAFLGV